MVSNTYFLYEFHGLWYYIDATVYESGVINVLMYDTDEDIFYQVSEGGRYEIEPYED